MLHNNHILMLIPISFSEIDKIKLKIHHATFCGGKKVSALIQQRNISCKSYVMANINKNEEVIWWNACKGIKLDMNTPFGIGVSTTSDDSFCPMSMEIVFNDAKRTKYCTQFRYEWYYEDKFSGQKYVAKKGPMNYCRDFYARYTPKEYVNPVPKGGQ